MGFESQQQYAKSIWGGEPDVKGNLEIYDPRFFQRQNQLLRDWTANRNTWKDTFSKWRTEYDANTPAFKENVSRENDYLKYLSGGGFEATLAGIRAKESAADKAEKENALAFASGDADRAKFLGGSGIGNSSADFARRLRAGSRIEADFSGREAARERADLDWVNRLRLGTMGKLNENLARLENRTLLPQQLSDQELDTMIRMLYGLGTLTQFGAQPKFWEEANDLDKIGGTFALAGNAYATYASMGTGTAGHGTGNQTNSANKSYISPTSSGSSNPSAMSYDNGNSMAWLSKYYGG